MIKMFFKDWIEILRSRHLYLTMIASLLLAFGCDQSLVADLVIRILFFLMAGVWRLRSAVCGLVK